MHIRANDAYLEMFGFETFEDVEGMSLLDLVAPQHVDGFKQLLKKLSKGEAPPPRYELEARDVDGSASPPSMEFAPRQLRRRALRAGGVPPRRSSIRSWRARSRICASATRSPACSTARPSCARSRTRSPTPRRATASTACCCSNPTTTSACCRTSAWIRPTPCSAALAARLREALGDDAHRRALRRTQLRRAAAQRRPRRDQRAGRAPARGIRRARVRRSASARSAITVSIGGVQIGEKIASVSQVLAKANQGVQSSAGVGGNRAEIFDPGAVDRAEEERIAGLGRRACAMRWTTTLRPALPAGDQPAGRHRRDLRDAAAPGCRRWRAGAADGVPADRRGARPAVARSTAGWSAMRSRSSAERMRTGKPTTLLVKVTPGLAQRRQPGPLHRRATRRAWRAGRIPGAAAAGGEGVHPPAGGAGLRRRRLARSTAGSGWSSSARGWIRSSCSRT